VHALRKTDNFKVAAAFSHRSTWTDAVNSKRVSTESEVPLPMKPEYLRSVAEMHQLGRTHVQLSLLFPQELPALVLRMVGWLAGLWTLKTIRAQQ
jgi:hypothetical protein